MTRPRLVLELGCFMGYSAMAMADGMSEGTTLYTCEKDAKAAHLARDLFVRHGYHTSSAEGTRQPVSIELLEGEAMNSLQDLARKRLQFDAVFLGMDP
jgi:predicted O-methyltransferase YrrM